MSSSRHLIVGLFLVLGIVLFAVGLFWIGNRRLLFEDQILLNAEFHNLSGLKNGAKVRVSGVDAGEVTQIVVPPDPESKFRVEFRVLDKFQSILRSDSVATIQTEGLVGNMMLQVGAGSNEGEPISPGDTIQSREPIELSDMVQQASETVGTLNKAILDIQGQVDQNLVLLEDLTTEATGVVANVSEDLERFVASGTKVAEDVEVLVAQVRRGEGTVGKLMNDPQVYEGLKATLDDVEQAADNIRQSTDEAKAILAELKSSGAAEDIAATIESVRGIAEQANQALADLRPKDGEGMGTMMADLQRTVSNAREATGDLAENMEALKRNFLMRGFFMDRGYFDMSDISVEEYRRGEFAPKRDRRRTWIHEHELFAAGPGGELELTEEGKRQLDSVMAEYLVYAPSTPLIIEGYSPTGGPSEQFLDSRKRGSIVRRYLLEKFDLKPNYVGVMPMGAVETEDGSGRYWEGVALIYFPEKEETKAENDVRMPYVWRGFHPVVGGLPSAGLALGATYQANDLLYGIADASITGRASHRNYLQGDVQLDLPRLWNGNLFLETTTRVRNFPQENFFGLGPDSEKDERTDYRLEGFDTMADFGYRPTRRLRVGGSAGYMVVNVGPGKDSAFPSIEEGFTPANVPGLERQSDFLLTGAFAEYAFGEYPPPLPFLPSASLSGSYQFRWTHFDGRAIDAASFERFDVDVRHFIPVRRNRGIVAVRGLASLTEAGEEHRAPFFLLPTLGGSETLRGFPNYRFRDNGIMAVTVEYRHMLRPFMDLVFFGDAGTAFPELTKVALNDIEGSAGVGTRFKLGANVLVGVDVGFGREGVRASFHGSHTF